MSLECHTCGESVRGMEGRGCITYSVGSHFTRKGKFCPGGTMTYARTNPKTNELEYLEKPVWKKGEETEATSWFSGLMAILKDASKKEKEVMCASALQERTTITGIEIQLDICPEACREFGFELGDRIEDNFGREGVVVGVAPVPGTLPDYCCHAEKSALWVAMDEWEGRVGFFPNPSLDLRKI